jgi:chemotaxis protein methyltransferase CheR
VNETTDAAPVPRVEDALEELELRLLLEALAERYGYDLRGYVRRAILRRVHRRMVDEGCTTISGLTERVLHDPGVLERLLLDMSHCASSMFSDPPFFAALRAMVFPRLRTYPFVRVWDAGCSSGEEAFSLAILLREEGLDDRARLYATDINDAVVRKAREGVFPRERVDQYAHQYRAAGGRDAFSDYYEPAGTHIRFDPSLVEKSVFSRHNLVVDGPFNEFHLIVCRNVLTEFDADLRVRVHDLLYDSLARFGILALGGGESIGFTPHTDGYEELDPMQGIYRKVA